MTISKNYGTAVISFHFFHNSIPAGIHEPLRYYTIPGCRLQIVADLISSTLCEK